MLRGLLKKKVVMETSSVAQRCLERLHSAASLASKVEERYANVVSQSCVEEFLEDYYDLLDPEGVQERREENRVFEDESQDQSLYVAGHLFTYDQMQFWSIIHCLPLEIK